MTEQRRDMERLEESVQRARFYLDTEAPRPFLRFELRLIVKRALRMWWRARKGGQDGTT